MYKNILVPLDGSPLSEQALPHAIAIAERFQSDNILLRVRIPLPRTPETAERALRRAEKSAAAFIHEDLERVTVIEEEQGTATQKAALEERPHFQIIQYTEANQIDLTVMWSRGQSGLSRWMIGSVSDRVMRGASLPVLLVRPQNKEE